MAPMLHKSQLQSGLQSCPGWIRLILNDIDIHVIWCCQLKLLYRSGVQAEEEKLGSNPPVLRLGSPSLKCDMPLGFESHWPHMSTV